MGIKCVKWERNVGRRSSPLLLGPPQLWAGSLRPPCQAPSRGLCLKIGRFITALGASEPGPVGLAAPGCLGEALGCPGCCFAYPRALPKHHSSVPLRAGRRGWGSSPSPGSGCSGEEEGIGIGIGPWALTFFPRAHRSVVSPPAAGAGAGEPVAGPPPPAARPLSMRAAAKWMRSRAAASRGSSRTRTWAPRPPTRTMKSPTATVPTAATASTPPAPLASSVSGPGRGWGRGRSLEVPRCRLSSPHAHPFPAGRWRASVPEPLFLPAPTQTFGCLNGVSSPGLLARARRPPRGGGRGDAALRVWGLLSRSPALSYSPYETFLGPQGSAQ